MSELTMPCRDISQLLPVLQRGANEFLRRCKEAGLNVLVTQTYRSTEYQNSLYARGRTKPGSIVTNCKGGQSPHEFRYAFDICRTDKPINPKTGKPDAYYNGDGFFEKCGKIWQYMGGEWGGSWTGFVDIPHFQYTAGFTDQQLRTAKIPDTAKMPWEADIQKDVVIHSILIAPEVYDAIKVLVANGVIASPEYWIQAVKSDKVEYLGQLIINMANKIH